MARQQAERRCTVHTEASARVKETTRLCAVLACMLAGCGSSPAPEPRVLGQTATDWSINVSGPDLPEILRPTFGSLRMIQTISTDGACAPYWVILGSFHSEEVAGLALSSMLMEDKPTRGAIFEMPRTPGPTVMLPEVADWQFASDHISVYYHVSGGTYRFAEWSPEQITLVVTDASFCAYPLDPDDFELICSRHDFTIDLSRLPTSPEPGPVLRNCLDSDNPIQEGYVDLDGNEYCDLGDCG